MRPALSFLLVIVAPLLAGCGNPIDGEQLRICREVIPALDPAGTAAVTEETSGF